MQRITIKKQSIVQHKQLYYHSFTCEVVFQQSAKYGPIFRSNTSLPNFHRETYCSDHPWKLDEPGLLQRRTPPVASICSVKTKMKSREQRRESKSRPAANPWPRPAANRSSSAPSKKRRQSESDLGSVGGG